MAFQFTDDNFQAAAIDTEKVVVVDFWAPWCGPCKMVAPIMDELAEEYSKTAVVGKLNVDDNPNISMQFRVRSIPTVLVIKNGEVVEKFVGARSKADYAEAIEKHTVSA